MSDEIRVVIVDDHAAFREGLEAVLAGRGGVHVVGTFGDAESAIEALGELRADIVLMDLTMAGIGGIEATSRVVAQHPQARVLVLTMLDDIASVRLAVAAGASGYIAKSSGLDEIVRSLRMVYDGQFLLGSTVPRDVFEAPVVERAGPQGYTRREVEVLKLLAVGTTTGRIASTLGVSIKTVRNMLSTVYLKLGVEDRGQAVLAAKELVE